MFYIPKLNKRGSDLQSFLYVISILFVIGVLIFMLSFVDLSIYQNIQSSINNIQGSGTEANQTLTKIIDFEQSMWDYFFLALVLGYVLSLIITSYATMINPVYFFVFVIFSGIGLFVGVALSNAWQEIAASPSLAVTAARFPIMNTLLGNFYPIFITLILAFLILMLFGKRYFGGSIER